MNKYEELKDNTFYKYMSLEKLDRFFSYISVEKLYGALYSELNDPFEGRFNKTNLSAGDSVEVYKKLSRTRICSMFQKKDDQLIPDNFLMWSHYANGHSGCCFEFTLTQRYNNNNWIIIPIEYKDQMPAPTNSDNDSIYEIVSVKTPEWSSENEVRAVRIYPTGSTASKFYHINLKAVYFGLNVKQEQRELYTEIIKALKPDVKCYRITKQLNGNGSYPSLRCAEL